MKSLLERSDVYLRSTYDPHDHADIGGIVMHDPEIVMKELNRRELFFEKHDLNPWIVVNDHASTVIVCRIWMGRFKDQDNADEIQAMHDRDFSIELPVRTRPSCHNFIEIRVDKGEPIIAESDLNDLQLMMGFLQDYDRHDADKYDHIIHWIPQTMPLKEFIERYSNLDNIWKDYRIEELHATTKPLIAHMKRVTLKMMGTGLDTPDVNPALEILPKVKNIVETYEVEANDAMSDAIKDLYDNSINKIENLMMELDHAWMTIVDNKIDSDVNKIHESVYNFNMIASTIG
jgi:hypothetical protein